MDATIEDANDLLRAAVKMRREAQSAGRPHEEWYDVSQGVTEPMSEDAKAEETQHVLASGTFANARHLSGTTEESSGVQRGPSAAEVLERFAPDRPGSLPFLELLEEVRQLHMSKSQDYGSEADPLANIRQGAEFVGIEPWRGCMVRIADKVQRLRTYCQTGRLVHEGVRDTLLDLSAYSLLAIVLFDEAKDG